MPRRTPILTVFTIPSKPAAGQRVNFVARYTGPAEIARTDILINGRVVKSCDDTVCLYRGGPFQGKSVKYAARVIDVAGKPTVSRYKELTFRAVDKTPPLLTISYRPKKPTTGQKVTMTAHAKDPGGVAKIEILVNQRLVKSCAGEKCSHSGGPYPPGRVTYGANAYDRTGNRAWTGYKTFTVTKPEPVGDATIQGQITGRHKLVGHVNAYNLDQPGKGYTGRPDSRGHFRITGLPTGRYDVTLAGRGKEEIWQLCEPLRREINCDGKRSYTANFKVR